MVCITSVKQKIYMEDNEKKDKLCPFTKNPDKDCYCINMNSQKIISVIYYCSENYRECMIYRRLNSED